MWRLLKYCLSFLMVVFAISCDSSRIFEEWEEMDQVVWDADSAVSFNFEVTDTTQECSLMFGVRNTNLYPYRNIWLYTTLEGPDDIAFQDTVQFVLANNTGEWYGNRSASVYTLLVPLYSQLRFYKPGQYRMQLQHGMRKEELKGISSIGFRIETKH